MLCSPVCLGQMKMRMRSVKSAGLGLAAALLAATLLSGCSSLLAGQSTAGSNRLDVADISNIGD